jgi:hypothetical protein
MKNSHFALILSCLISLNFACEDKFAAKDMSGTYNVNKGTVRITATVKREEELPICDATSQGLAGYIVSSDEFMKCKNGRWRAVTPGDTSSNYMARGPIRYYEWEDSVEKKRWFIPLETEVASEEQVNKGCSQGWKLPSKAELMAASSNGLLKGIRSHGGRSFQKGWTADFEIIDGVSQRVAINLAESVGKSSAVAVDKASAGLYCISLAGN